MYTNSESCWDQGLKLDVVVLTRVFKYNLLEYKEGIKDKTNREKTMYTYGSRRERLIIIIIAFDPIARIAFCTLLYLRSCRCRVGGGGRRWGDH